MRHDRLAGLAASHEQTSRVNVTPGRLTEFTKIRGWIIGVLDWVSKLLGLGMLHVEPEASEPVY